MSQPHSRAHEIVDTLIDLVEDRGVEHITTAALAHRLGFTEAALYRYFSGKGAILAAALRELAEELFASMTAELSSPPADAVVPGIEQQLALHLNRFTAHQGALLEIMVVATTTPETELQEAGNAFLEEYFQRMAVYFQRLGESGTIGEEPRPRELASMWICQLLGGFVRSRLTRQAWAPERAEGYHAFISRLTAAAHQPA